MPQPHSSTALAIGLAALLLATTASTTSAGVISFNNPDLVLSPECRTAPDHQPGQLGTGYLRWYVEQGVRFEVWNEVQAISPVWRHPCDPSQFIQGAGVGGFPIIEPEGHTFTNILVFA